MPPRRKTAVTPKASGPASIPPAPTRRASRAISKAAGKNKKPSPKIVTKDPVDSDKVFVSKAGGRGSLKYDGAGNGQGEGPTSDVEPEEEVTPTPSSSKAKGKKVVPLKAEKVAGSRRVQPRPIKRKVEVALTRSRARRVVPPPKADSDVEIVEDGTLMNDEGYESKAASEAGSADEREEVEEVEEVEGEDEDEDEDEDGVMEEGAREVGGEESSTDDGDANGNFIDEEGEESGGDGDMDVDDEEADDAEEEGGEEEEEEEEEPPAKSKAKSENKRTAVNLSDAEDAPPTRKRRTAAVDKTEKTIEAVGHTSKVTLNIRSDRNKAPPAQKKVAPGTRGVARKPKHVNVETDLPDIGNGTGNTSANAKDKKVLKDQLTGKGKSKAAEESAESEGVEPEKNGCEVTEFSKQSTILVGSYKGLEPLTNHKIATTNELQFGSLDVIREKDQFPENLDAVGIAELVVVRQIPTAYMYNPGRSPVKSLVDKTFGAGSNICPKGAGAGELADIIVFGFVLESSLIEGRKYTFPGAGGQTQTRALKELQILPLQQEFERTLAVLSMVWGGKIINLNVSEEGGITFSTKHSLVDENGNPEKKKAALGNKFKAQAPKASTAGVVHAAIQRRPREGTDPVPVFNSTRHFIEAPEGFIPALRKLQVDEILTQRVRADPNYNSEIPQGSLVAVHSTVSVYTSARGQKGKFMSFNLLAVQILALPNDA